MNWNLKPRIVEENFTFVTNNAKDFGKLYAQESVHPGLIIIVPQVAPDRQRELFDGLLDDLGPDALLVNEVIEIELGAASPLSRGMIFRSLRSTESVNLNSIRMAVDDVADLVVKA